MQYGEALGFLEAMDGLNSAPRRGRVDPKGWTVFEIPSTPWVPGGHRIRSVRSRLGPSQPSRLKSVVLASRALQPVVDPVAQEKQRVAHFAGDGGQRGRDRDRTCSWKFCIRSGFRRRSSHCRAAGALDAGGDQKLLQL